MRCLFVVVHLIIAEEIVTHIYTFRLFDIVYIWESLYIIDGELTARWRDGSEERFETVSAGDFIETERTPHTFSNDSNEMVRFLVIKHMPSSENFREVLKTDKILD
jgi:uncharacterized RmlC-like cupin family protein